MHGAMNCTTVTELLGKEVRVESYVDIKTVFDVVAKDGKRTENVAN